MITLSLNFDKLVGTASRSTHEKQVRDIVNTHLGFPGSDKLKMGVTIKENGAASVSFTGPKDAIAEAKRLWKENVKPVAKKVKNAAASMKKTATKTAQKAVKSAKAKTKAAKRAPAKVKAKVKKMAKTTKTAKKRKS